MKTLLSTHSQKSEHRSADIEVASHYSVSLATVQDRQEIYRIRHRVYASELGQHTENPSFMLRDDLDDHNHYIVAKIYDTIVGFISITPPSAERYSIEKYFARADLPFDFHDNLYEIRLLSVLKPHRNRSLFLLLSYASLRWIEAHGGTHACGMGRMELIRLYQRFGFNILNHTTRSGDVAYQMMHAPIENLNRRVEAHGSLFEKLASHIDWQLAFPFYKPSDCFHGGAFFDAIGDTFKTLEHRENIINADVLDAWFPPAPGVLHALENHLPWLLRTSPPTGCEGLISTIAKHRNVEEKNLLPGSGSSDLIFRALCHWLDKNSKVLILDPTYGEYCHVLENVIGCTVDRFQLNSNDHFRVDLESLSKVTEEAYDLIILVNPNSPTGQHVPRQELEPFLNNISPTTRVWIDETYVDYVDGDQSLESYAAHSENIIVCKSMSKVYALSGARVAYLCAGSHQLESLRVITPPWVVGLPAQVAAVKAMEDPDYYAERREETHQLRDDLTKELTDLGWNILPSVANFLLCELPDNEATTREWVDQCRAHGLYLRDPGNMGAGSSRHLIRIAVKDAATNARMVEIIHAVSRAH